MAGPDRDVLIRRILATSRVGPEVADLAAVAREVGEGMGTSGCGLAIADGETGPEAPRWYAWSADPAGSRQPELRTHDVWYAGEQVGWLGLPAGVGRSAAHGQLLTEILVVLGPVLDSARLAIALRRELTATLARAEAIASARRRTVARMDEQRRVLERNLHDGAQHHLVNLRLMVGLLEHQLATGDDEAVAAQLWLLGEQITDTEAVLYDTASGILPLSLVTGGLCAALRTEVGHQDNVTLQLPPGLQRRYPQVVETAVFYACLEAVTNARKHAAGAAIVVTLRDTYRGLWFRVRDDGPGFDLAALPAGSGLDRLSDRINAVGGTVTLRSTPGAGTVLEGTVAI